MEKPLETACVGMKVEWGGASGNHQGRANNVSQVDGVSDMVPVCHLCEGRVYQRKNDLCQHFCLGENCPSPLAPTLIPDNFLSFVSDAFQAAVPELELKGFESK